VVTIGIELNKYTIEITTDPRKATIAMMSLVLYEL
jgi:hypothetical protein